MNKQASIERFILEELLPESGGTKLDPDSALISTGILDSLALLRLITFLEQEMGIVIGDGDVVSDNFETLGKITAFVEGKTAGARSEPTQTGNE